MRADRSSLKSEREDNCCRKFAKKRPVHHDYYKRELCYPLSEKFISYFDQCHFHMDFDKSKASIMITRLFIGSRILVERFKIFGSLLLPITSDFSG